MKIIFVDTLGLCYDGSTLSKRGLGGSESAIIYMSRELVKLGHDVIVYNDCKSDDCVPGFYAGVDYRPLKDIENIDFEIDIAIASRSVVAFCPDSNVRFKSFIPLPDFTKLRANSKKKIVWMHDTFIDGDDLFEDLLAAGHIDEIFTLSDWHTSYITTCDHGKRRDFSVLKNKVFQTRNGVGVIPEWIDVTKKDKNSFVYNASATKGMVPLVTKIWPQIKAAIPDAKLTVIGGYYKFREGSEPDEQHKTVIALANNPDNERLGINFTGVIPQYQISSILKTASFFLYPNAFPETYGISTLEALAHNVPIVTCRRGALEEVAIDIASYKIPYPIEKDWACPWLNEEYQINQFVTQTINAYYNTYLHQQKMYACNQIKEICGWDTIAKQWNQHFYHILGEYLSVDLYREVQKINYKVSNTFGRRFENPEQRCYPKFTAEYGITVVSPVYNAEKYVERCIRSVAAQDYFDYTMYIIDDKSTDNTVQVVRDTIKSLPENIRDNFILITNHENKGAVENQHNTIFKYAFQDIVMLLDGDDWLVNNPNIFNMYNEIYANGAEMTYGSCWSLADKIPLISQEYPPAVKQKRDYKNYKFNWGIPYTHLRTFTVSLIDSIDDNMLKDLEGNFYKAGGDGALFYELLKVANPDKIVVVPDIVYVYNDKNDLNDYKVNAEEQNKNAKEILSR